MVGFGSYSYTYANGRSGEWFAIGFAPRKQALTLYLIDGFGDYEELLARLGPHKTGKSCLHVKRLDEVDEGVLRERSRGRRRVRARCSQPMTFTRVAGHVEVADGDRAAGSRRAIGWVRGPQPSVWHAALTALTVHGAPQRLSDPSRDGLARSDARRDPTAARRTGSTRGRARSS